jgi:FK506-binding protein 1
LCPSPLQPTHRHLFTAPSLPAITTYEGLLAALASPDCLVVDVRQPEELTTDGSIPGSLNLPLGGVSAALSLAPERWQEQYGAPAPGLGTPIVFSCLAGVRSAKAQALAVSLGFTNTSNYLGGWQEWTARSAPGLALDSLQPGDGATFPRPGDFVTCHYVLSLQVQQQAVLYTAVVQDGQEVDSSRARGQPFQFRLGQGEVIQGWEQGLAQMSVGQRARCGRQAGSPHRLHRLTIGPELAYGSRGVPGAIPGGATLTFDVELLGVS